MPDFSPSPRHRRDGHPVLALAGVIGVTAIAGLGVVLAVLSGRDPAPQTALPAAAGPRATVAPAPGFPAGGPFFSSPAAPRLPAPAERPEREPERAAERPGETPEDVPERERLADERDAPPPPGRHGAAGPSSRSRPPSQGSAGRPKDTERRRPARSAAPGTAKPARGPARGNTATGKSADDTPAKGAAARDAAVGDSASMDAAVRSAAEPPMETDGASQIQDPCLRFDDLRRDYCYEVLRGLTQ